ncbi:AP2 domain-containing protein [Staphylococcus simulans]|uniref:AP2 domain-containing protein n=1 Tax=Staphylococcus simulans TaxID=1286 RepID=UPI003CF0D978
MVKSIFLQDGEEIFVDDEDYEKVSKHVWWKNTPGNNTRLIYSKVNGKDITLLNFIKNNSYQKVKNNYFTRDNLSDKGNHARWGRPVGKVSKYKGVGYNKRRKKWIAHIYVDGKSLYLGQYDNEDEAAKSYNNAVDEYFNGHGFKNEIGIDNRFRKELYSSPKFQNNKRVGKFGYRGVTNSNGYITAHKHINGKHYTFAYTKDKDKAALIYNKCVFYLYGDTAILNDVPMTDELKEFIDNWEIPERIKALKEGANDE